MLTDWYLWLSSFRTLYRVWSYSLLSYRDLFEVYLWSRAVSHFFLLLISYNSLKSYFSHTDTCSWAHSEYSIEFNHMIYWAIEICLKSTHKAEQYYRKIASQIHAEMTLSSEKEDDESLFSFLKSWNDESSEDCLCLHLKTLQLSLQAVTWQ